MLALGAPPKAFRNDTLWREGMEQSGRADIATAGDKRELAGTPYKKKIHNSP